MKTFKDLQIGDVVYLIKNIVKSYYIGQIKSIEHTGFGIWITLIPIIGLNSLSFYISDNDCICSCFFFSNYRIYLDEQRFVKDLSLIDETIL